MCLTTVPEGTEEYCHQRAAKGGFLSDDLTDNPRWNYMTALTPELSDVFDNVVKTVSDRLIEALQAQPQLTV